MEQEPRDYKFRAWDGHTMAYFKLGGATPSDKNFSWVTDQKIMQCTGMKDRKGRDIYEGDILQHKFEEGTKKVKVEWITSNCMSCSGYYGVTTNDTPCDHLHTAENAVVIGNLFEDPSLFPIK